MQIICAEKERSSVTAQLNWLANQREREPVTPRKLRPYQSEAVDAVIAEWDRGIRSTMLVLACGGGKTITGSEIIRLRPGRALWLADTDFLLDQGRQALEAVTGEWTTLEQAKWRADSSRIVVGSIMTMRGRRLTDYPRNYFSTVVIDEAHIAAAKTPTEILNHFNDAAILGLTATPARLDRKPLVGPGCLFETIAYQRDIEFMIDQGYFVPVVPRVREIRSVDLSEVRTQAGDLHLGDLEKQIVANAAPIARIAWEESEHGKLPTLIYTPGVASAKAVASTLNEWWPESAVAVDGETPVEERRAIKDDFGGKVRFLPNCQLVTKGVDLPAIRCVVMARLTKSRTLFIQCGTRGGRPTPGIGELPTAEERRAAIAASDKPNYKLVDIAGNAGRHVLMGAADLTDAPMTEQERKHIDEAIRKPRKPEQTLDEAVSEGKKAAADELLAEAKAKADRIAKAAASAVIKTVSKAWDPFRKYGVGEFKAEGIELEWIAQPPTPEQVEWLVRNRMASGTHTRGTVKALQDQARRWVKQGMASFNQRRELSAAKLPVDLPYSVASRVISKIRACHRNPRSYGPSVAAIIAAGREVGEEG